MIGVGIASLKISGIASSYGAVGLQGVGNIAFCGRGHSCYLLSYWSDDENIAGEIGCLAVHAEAKRGVVVGRACSAFYVAQTCVMVYFIRAFIVTHVPKLIAVECLKMPGFVIVIVRFSNINSNRHSLSA